MSRFPAALATLLLLAAAPAFAELEYTVKVSMSPDDPDVPFAYVERGDLAEFHVFVEGGPLTGVEFGLSLTGGELIGYLIATDWAWIALPVPRPYPGTIVQAVAGNDCLGSPVYLGRLLVRLTEDGEPITVDVIPSEVNDHAFIVRCDLSTSNGIYAFPAAANVESPEPHEVHGKILVQEGWKGSEREIHPSVIQKGSDEESNETP